MSANESIAAVFERIALDLIDEPDIAMRQSFGETEMDDLANSIAAHGLFQPIGVARRGDRFVIGFGHRRFIAHIRAGMGTILCRIFPEGTPLELMKTIENSVREDVNPADEALYYKALLDGMPVADTDKLAAMVGRKRQLVEIRLALLSGYPAVFESLQKGAINQAVAQEFNRYKTEAEMLPHLDAAIKGGVRASQVRQWRTNLELLGNYYPTADTAGEPLPPGQGPAVPAMSCCVCGGTKDPYNLEFLYIHRGGPCAEMIANVLARFKGEE